MRFLRRIFSMFSSGGGRRTTATTGTTRGRGGIGGMLNRLLR